MPSTRILYILLFSLACVGCLQPKDNDTPRSGHLRGAGGTRIFYEVSGAGEDTVIAIHGGPGAGINNIRPDLEKLAENHVVIFYDQRGGGRSELPDDTTLLSARHFVDDLDSVRAHFGLGSASLVAHSFGAIIVAAYAQRHPHRVRRMVFLAATGPSRQEAAKFYRSQPAVSDTATNRIRLELLQSLIEGTAANPVTACREFEALGKKLAEERGEFVDWKSTTCNMPEEAVAYYYQYTAPLGADGFGKWDFTDSLGHVEAPLLVIDGERDTLGLPMERAWAAAVPNACLLVVPGAGRAAYAERPDIVFDAISQFLAGRRLEDCLTY